MTRRSPYDEDYDYDEEEFEDPRKGIRRLRKEPDSYEKRKKLDREGEYDRDHEHDDRR